jgi:hypothetical protein
MWPSAALIRLTVTVDRFLDEGKAGRPHWMPGLMSPRSHLRRAAEAVGRQRGRAQKIANGTAARSSACRSHKRTSEGQSRIVIYNPAQKQVISGGSVSTVLPYDSTSLPLCESGNHSQTQTLVPRQKWRAACVLISLSGTPAEIAFS